MPREVTVRSGRAELAVESTGAGRTIVCLHAGVCDKRMWRPLAERLAPACEVIAYDRRGFGATPAVDEARSDVDDLCAVLDAAAGVSHAPVVLLGASMGGALAIDLALAAPERVAALVLMAPAVSGEPDTAHVPAAIQGLIAELEAASSAGDLERINRLEVHAWLDGPTMPEGRVRGALRELVLDMNRIALRQTPPSLRLTPAPAYPRLEAVRPPTLVIGGNLDFPDRVALCQELAARLPRARLSLLPGVAHLPSLEQPDRVAALVRSFLAEVLDGG
jgi:pimeloyl-ACP methyl ester carboxylesterase